MQKLATVARGCSFVFQIETLVLLVAVLIVAPLLGRAVASEAWYVFAFLVGVALIPVFVRWPVVSTFGVYAFLAPFDSVSAIADAGGASLMKFIGILSVVVLLANGLLGRRHFVRPPFAALCWGLFMFWATLSAAWALDQDLVFQRLPTALSLFLFYLVAVSIRPSGKELFAICMLAVLGGMIAAGTAYFYTDTVKTSARGTLVLGGQAANPNALAAALILPLALAIGGYVGLRSVLLKAAAITAVALIGVGVYITASRKAILAIIAMIIVLLYRLRARWRILIAVAVLVALVAAMPQTATDRIETVFTGEDATGSGRTKIWEVGIAALERFGVFGAGLSNFTVMYNLSASHGPYLGPRGAHNTYLGIWVELGIVGLILILAAVGTHIWAAHRSRPQGTDDAMLSAIEAAGIGILVIAFFADMLWSKDFWLPWILLTWSTCTELAGEDQEHPRGTNPVPSQPGSKLAV